MYQLFYEGNEPLKLTDIAKREIAEQAAWGASGRDARMLGQFCRLFSRMDRGNRDLILHTAKIMTKRKAMQGIKG
jgi:hypothetical protein